MVLSGAGFEVSVEDMALSRAVHDASAKVLTLPGLLCTLGLRR